MEAILNPYNSNDFLGLFKNKTESPDNGSEAPKKTFLEQLEKGTNTVNTLSGIISGIIGSTKKTDPAPPPPAPKPEDSKKLLWAGLIVVSILLIALFAFSIRRN